MATQPGAPPPDTDNPQTPVETPPPPVEPGEPATPTELPGQSPPIDVPDTGPAEIP